MSPILECGRKQQSRSRFRGIVAYNRGLVLALSMLPVVAFWRYSFSEKGMSARQLKKDDNRRKKEALVEPNVVSRLPLPNQAASASARLLARTRLEMGMIFKSPAFLVLILLGLTNSGGALWFANELYGTPSVPDDLCPDPALAGFLWDYPDHYCHIFCGRIGLERRERSMNEIIDSTALPNWAYFIPKVIAVTAVLVATLFIASLAAIFVQLLRGYVDLELHKYFFWFILPFAWTC